MAVGADGEHNEPAADDGIDHCKGHHREAYSGPRLYSAVDVAPVQQTANQPLPPRLSRFDFGPRRNGHGLFSDAGTEPVAAGSLTPSIVTIIEPIRSRSPVLTRLGRSGRFFKLSYCAALRGFKAR